MGGAKYCDKCGKLFNTALIEVFKVTIEAGWNEPIEADLCHECRDKIEDFVYGKHIK